MDYGHWIFHTTAMLPYFFHLYHQYKAFQVCDSNYNYSAAAIKKNKAEQSEQISYRF